MLLPTIILVVSILVYFFCYVIIIDKNTYGLDDKIKELNILNLVLFVIVLCYISLFFGKVAL